MITQRSTTISIIIFSFVYNFNISSAHALSCTAPRLNEAVLEDAIIVFEGTTSNARDLTLKEQKALKAKKITSKGGTLEHVKVFDFTVTKKWKGVDEGSIVEIVRNTYWGDIFTEGENYFILSSQKINDLYITHLCDHTLNIKYTKDYGFPEILNKFFAGETK